MAKVSPLSWFPFLPETIQEGATSVDFFAMDDFQESASLCYDTFVDRIPSFGFDVPSLDARRNGPTSRDGTAQASRSSNRQSLVQQAFSKPLREEFLPHLVHPQRHGVAPDAPRRRPTMRLARRMRRPTERETSGSGYPPKRIDGSRLSSRIKNRDLWASGSRSSGGGGECVLWLWVDGGG
eukprot:scaffold281_cov318-Pavlova_lutheri.AAC.34